MANDVIQNSKKKGPEYGREFFICLPKVFKYIGEECTDEKLFKSLGRILSIWEERGVYDKSTISDYRSRLSKEKAAEENTAAESSKNEKKRKVDDESNNHRSTKKAKSNDSTKTTDANNKLNGTPAETSVSLSPHVPLGDPPEPEELIEVLTKLMDNSAASDVVVREQIANFPKEISDLSFVAKLEDKDQAKKFSEKVRFTLRLLVFLLNKTFFWVFLSLLWCNLYFEIGLFLIPKIHLNLTVCSKPRVLGFSMDRFFNLTARLCFLIHFYREMPCI